MCNPKKHYNSNIFSHLAQCSKYHHVVINGHNQTTLTFRSEQVNGLVATSQGFNSEAYRMALAIFVILDEQPFMVVEGEGFKHLCA